MRFFTRVFLPFLLLGYIATETYFKLQHTSLCGNTGCKLAGELLNFNAIYLNYFGAVGVAILIVLGILSLKNKAYESLFYITLYAAIAFEATLLSYQFIANPEPCLFCLGIFSSLLLIALLSHIKHFLFTLAIALAIFMALNTLAVTKNRVFVTAPGNYLIQSESCPHCKKVKAYLEKSNTPYIPLSIKEASARNFLKFVGIRSIPVLLIKDASDTKIITGDQKIITYFKSNYKQKKEEKHSNPHSAQSSSLDLGTTDLSSDFLSQGGGDSGCEITVTQIPDCEKNTATHLKETE